MFAQVNALMYRNVDIKQHFTMVIWMLHNDPLFRGSGAKMKLTSSVLQWHLEWV